MLAVDGLPFSDQLRVASRCDPSIHFILADRVVEQTIQDVHIQLCDLDRLSKLIVLRFRRLQFGFEGSGFAIGSFEVALGLIIIRIERFIIFIEGFMIGFKLIVIFLKRLKLRLGCLQAIVLLMSVSTQACYRGKGERGNNYTDKIVRDSSFHFFLHIRLVDLLTVTVVRIVRQACYSVGLITTALTVSMGCQLTPPASEMDWIK